MGLNCVENETFEAYRAKIEGIVEQLLSGEQHLAIWGAGENGERFKRYCDAIHVPVRYLVDSNPALWGTNRWGLPIIAPIELGQRENAIILISFQKQQIVQEVALQAEKLSRQWGKEIYCFDDRFFYLLQNIIHSRERAAEEIVISMYKAIKDDQYLNVPILSPRLITTRCNLKCRDCVVRIPYLKEHRDEPIEIILSEINRSLEVIDSITSLEVCGGESFLYRDLIPLLNKLKEYKQIFSIHIITNGTVNPNEDVWKAMQSSNIVLKISYYGKLSQKIYELENKCKEKDIPYFIQDCSWVDWSPVSDLNYSAEDLNELFKRCDNKDFCVRNWDGTIYRCGFQRIWSDAGLVDDIDRIRKDGIDLNDRRDDKELKKRLKKYLTTTVPFEICKYCKGNTPIPRAIQL